MAPTHSIELSSENYATAKRFHQKWDFGSSGRVLRSCFCKMIMGSSHLMISKPQTNNTYRVSWLVEHSSANFLCKTLNYWMSSVSAFTADQTRRHKFVSEFIIVWTVLPTLSCNSNPSASPHDGKPSCTFRLWPRLAEFFDKTSQYCNEKDCPVPLSPIRRDHAFVWSIDLQWLDCR